MRRAVCTAQLGPGRRRRYVAWTLQSQQTFERICCAHVEHELLAQFPSGLSGANRVKLFPETNGPIPLTALPLRGRSQRELHAWIEDVALFHMMSVSEQGVARRGRCCAARENNPRHIRRNFAR